MRGVVDADTHIIEHPGIWELMDEAMYPRRPVILKAPSDTLYKDVNAFWLIDGEIFPRPVGKGSFGLHVPGADREETRQDVPAGVRFLTDVEGRLRALDEREVEIEIIYPTLFIMYLTNDVELEVALCRAYNRYMARVWAQGRGRLRWVAPLPLRSITESLREMHVAKEHGAVGVLFRGVEGDRSLAEPYFFPLYEEASRLNLAVCIHTGAGAPAITRLFDVRYSHVVPHVRMQPLIAFGDLVRTRVPERFPELRIGFIEAAASWVPYLLHLLRRASKAQFKVGPSGPEWDEWWGPKLFRDYRLYIACEADEDIPYLLNYIGEDNLLIGSDYGHQDQSRDDGVVATIKRRPDLSERVKEKMLTINPRVFYGL
ncbi:MAG TPA: amidohydrolase family protein [Chloroflexota bacterium]|nr:amidohydrolase family protein [Chloroflexota bacterium]